VGAGELLVEQGSAAQTRDTTNSHSEAYGDPAAAHARQHKAKSDTPSVAATVHEAKWRAQHERCFEATGVPSLNAQSPSER
jgi:hypothetical protein